MKKFFTSTLLTAVAVPFMFAAPAPKQAASAPAADNNAKTTAPAKTKTAKKAGKSHLRKANKEVK